MHAWLSACQFACIRTFTWGAAVLGTCSWAVTPYARTREGVSSVPPRKRVSRGTEGRGEIKRDGRHPLLIDEHRSHWDVPERRSNKARARINARENDLGERNTCLCPSVDMLKESGPRGGIATVDTYSFPSETDRSSFFYQRRRFVRSNRDWLGRLVWFNAPKYLSIYICFPRDYNFISWKLLSPPPLPPPAPSLLFHIFRAGCLRISSQYDPLY